MPSGVPGSRAPHGTLTRYTAHGCRCDLCRETGIKHQREVRRSKGVRERAEYLASIRAQHGTESRYVRGCRCERCKEASRLARAGRRTRETERS